jgi:putative ATP-grasp target RiPP
VWRDRDRFPTSTTDPETDPSTDPETEPVVLLGSGSVAAPVAAPVAVRPFGLRFVDYSPGRPRFTRPQVSLCPDRQVGVVAGELASDLMPMAATMTSVESDGKDVLRVDWVKDDK